MCTSHHSLEPHWLHINTVHVYINVVLCTALTCMHVRLLDHQEGVGVRPAQDHCCCIWSEPVWTNTNHCQLYTFQHDTLCFTAAAQSTSSTCNYGCLALQHAEQDCGMMQWSGTDSVIICWLEWNFSQHTAASPVSDAFKLWLFTNFSCQDIGFGHHFQLVIDNPETSVTALTHCHSVAGM